MFDAHFRECLKPRKQPVKQLPAPYVDAERDVFDTRFDAKAGFNELSHQGGGQVVGAMEADTVVLPAPDMPVIITKCMESLFTEFLFPVPAKH
jgi:hypothetical protein